MSPNQRLQQIIDANRPRVRGGMPGGFELLAGPTKPGFWKRKAAEGLICVRENRSALRAMGVEHKPVAARKLDLIHLQIATAKKLAADARDQRPAFRMAAE